MNAPLSGIRVIEFCRGAAGAYCGLLLADMGADVIMVDDPVDDLSNDSRSPLGESAQLGLRRNKRSVALDLLTLEGRSLAHTLVRGADVVIECLPPGTLASAGLALPPVAASNCRIPSPIPSTGISNSSSPAQARAPPRVADLAEP